MPASISMRSTATLFSAEGLWTGTRPRPGHSPLSLVNDHLIREAQRDLVYSGLTIKQIAHALGFEDAACFSRYFRKQTEATPTEFRQRRIAICRSGDPCAARVACYCTAATPT
jgi:AraC-like DNA-binding protein